MPLEAVPPPRSARHEQSPPNPVCPHATSRHIPLPLCRATEGVPTCDVSGTTPLCGVGRRPLCEPSRRYAEVGTGSRCWDRFRCWPVGRGTWYRAGEESRRKRRCWRGLRDCRVMDHHRRRRVSEAGAAGPAGEEHRSLSAAPLDAAPRVLLWRRRKAQCRSQRWYGTAAT